MPFRYPHCIIFEDVSTQSNTPGYTLSKWVEYYHTEVDKRDKIRNVISLEVSDTKLAEKIVPPQLVRDLDWVERFWPSNRKGKGHSYPKVQLYCLMGVAQAWTVCHSVRMGSVSLNYEPGLAYRLRWLLCVLSYFQRVKGS